MSLEAVHEGERYSRIESADGRTWVASDRGDYLTLDGAHGWIWLHTRHVDIVLNAPPVRYDHDGAGGLLLTGGQLTRGVRCSLAWGLSRFEHLEARRERMADYPKEVAAADACMASLIAAVGQAEAYVAKGEAA